MAPMASIVRTIVYLVSMVAVPGRAVLTIFAMGNGDAVAPVAVLIDLGVAGRHVSKIFCAFVFTSLQLMFIYKTRNNAAHE